MWHRGRFKDTSLTSPPPSAAPPRRLRTEGTPHPGAELTSHCQQGSHHWHRPCHMSQQRMHTSAVSPAGCPWERPPQSPPCPNPRSLASQGLQCPATPRMPAGCPCAAGPGSPFLPPRAEEAVPGAFPASPSPAGPTAAATGVGPQDIHSPGQGASFSPPHAGWHGEGPGAWRALRMREKT